jgi:hypothetical protein
MIKSLCIVLLLVLVSQLNAQNISDSTLCGNNLQEKNVIDLAFCDSLPTINVNSTLVGYNYSAKSIYVNKDSIKNGFEIKISMADYKIVGFLARFDCEECDVYLKYITGSKATIENFPVLKKIKGKELLGIECIRIRKDGIDYVAKPFQFHTIHN